jgi:hypothetical protein
MPEKIRISIPSVLERFKKVLFFNLFLSFQISHCPGDP